MFIMVVIERGHKVVVVLICYVMQLKDSVKEPNKFHNCETEKITDKSSDTAEYIELNGSSARDRHARRI